MYGMLPIFMLYYIVSAEDTFMWWKSMHYGINFSSYCHSSRYLGSNKQSYKSLVLFRSNLDAIILWNKCYLYLHRDYAYLKNRHVQMVLLQPSIRHLHWSTARHHPQPPSCLYHLHHRQPPSNTYHLHHRQPPSNTYHLHQPVRVHIPGVVAKQGLQKLGNGRRRLWIVEEIVHRSLHLALSLLAMKPWRRGWQVGGRLRIIWKEK